MSQGLPPLTEGCQVEFISDGKTAFEKLLKMIDGAERSIFISTFILGRDKVADSIVDHFDKVSGADRAGVNIALLDARIATLAPGGALDIDLCERDVVASEKTFGLAAVAAPVG